MLPASPDDSALRDHLASSWPAAERVAAGGWLLRATPAVPRGRLNSALPLVRDPDLAVVDEFYAARGLPAQVQLTPVDGHPRLTAEVDARGWGSRWTALVMAAPAAPVAGRAGSEGVALLDRPGPAWLEAWGAGEGRDPVDVRAHATDVMARLAGRAAFALTAGGEAVGIGVAEGGVCALFCLATRPGHRRRGLGTAVVAALAAWAVERGAPWLCLEVTERNGPAIALYERLGFARRYTYVHRLAATPDRPAARPS